MTVLYYFIFDRIVGVLVTFYQLGHFVMLIIRNLNLISIQSWTYLKCTQKSRLSPIYPGVRRGRGFLSFDWCIKITGNKRGGYLHPLLGDRHMKLSYMYFAFTKNRTQSKLTTLASNSGFRVWANRLTSRHTLKTLVYFRPRLPRLCMHLR